MGTTVVSDIMVVGVDMPLLEAPLEASPVVGMELQLVTVEDTPLW